MITLTLFLIDLFLNIDIDYYEERNVNAGDKFFEHIMRFIIWTILSIVVAFIIKKYIAICIVLWGLYLTNIVCELLDIRKLKRGGN